DYYCLSYDTSVIGWLF
nr:immunoglobulin light chain junction region [Macaca mulatta]